MKLFAASRITNRSAKQFDQLIRPHITALYQSAFKLTGSQSDAEDLVQDMLIKLFPKTGDMLKVVELRPWLFRVLYNQFIDHCRKQSRNPASEQNREHMPNGEILDFLPSSNPQPEVIEDKNQQSEQILVVLAGLSNEIRALVVLHLIDGFTLKELTAVFDVPLGTLKSRLHRIKAQLKILLQVEPFQSVKRDKEGRLSK